MSGAKCGKRDKTVKGILVAGTENDGHDRPDTPPSAPAHLHGPASLFDTQEDAG